MCVCRWLCAPESESSHFCEEHNSECSWGMLRMNPFNLAFLFIIFWGGWEHSSTHSKACWRIKTTVVQVSLSVVRSALTVMVTGARLISTKCAKAV